MNSIENLICWIYLVFSLIGFVISVYKIKNNKTFERSGIFNINSAFFWEDEVIFGLFWTLTSAVILYLQDWILFLLILSVFWFIRALGEISYWLNQQFSTIIRNPIEKMWLYKFFKNDSVWFIMQIYWQCIAVITIILSIFLTGRWFGLI